MATATQSKASGLFDQALNTFGETLKAGVKVQEEAAKWWTDALQSQDALRSWQSRSRDFVTEFIPSAQKSAEDWLKLVEKNANKSIALLKRAIESDTDADDLRRKTQELWEASLALVRENAQAVTDNNLKMMELWSKLLKKTEGGSKSK
jgi:hypothetical protein